VVNRRQLAVMDDLFVVDFVYIPHKSAKEKLSLADLKQQLRDESRTSTGFSYTIEQLTPFGEWVIVSWSAEGTLSTGVLQTWSGHTAWRVVNGRIAQMLPYKAVNSQPYSANEGQ
jgi:hypothetical protein